jgi:nucleoside-diphosphate-sugar epimerase
LILITGANGVVGAPLCQRLRLEQRAFKTVSRTVGADIVWDLEQSPTAESLQAMAGIKSVIHCAPIWFLPAQLDHLLRIGVGRLVVFSSTSVLSKTQSKDHSEQQLVKLLAAAEFELNGFCAKHKMQLTILRPSMIYGYGRDQNIMQIASFINRFGFMLLVGRADGKRQPIHADDLVAAALSILDKPVTFGKSYNLAGAETLSYRAMVERIFHGLGKKDRILSIHLCLFRLCLTVLATFSRFSFSPEMANRMSQNLNYSCADAIQDFGFQAQAFLTKPERDLSIQGDE